MATAFLEDTYIQRVASAFLFIYRLCISPTFSYYTVTRIDGILHQPHRMAPDQTIRVMGNKFDICDGHFQFFPTFPMEIFDRFEVFRLYSLYTGWKSSTFRSFPIIFPLHRMEIFDRFEVFQSDFLS
jgi:hypothetical protein